MKFRESHQTWMPDTCGCRLREPRAHHAKLTDGATAVLDGGDDEAITAALTALGFDVGSLRGMPPEEREAAIWDAASRAHEDKRQRQKGVAKLRNEIIFERSRPNPNQKQVSRLQKMFQKEREAHADASVRAAAAELVAYEEMEIEEANSRCLWVCELHEMVSEDEIPTLVRDENRTKNRALRAAKDAGDPEATWEFQGAGHDRRVVIRSKLSRTKKTKALKSLESSRVSFE